MPSAAITVVLNSNNNKKFTFIRPPSVEGSTVSTLKQAILREARNKFRLKGLDILYLKGGRNVLDDDPIEVIAIGDTVSVSKGEPYCGPMLPESNTAAETRIIGSKSYMDSSAIKQLQQLSTLQGVRLVVGMPDLHPGSRFPIGCAVASEGIYPALIGSDAGCGIALYRLAPPSKTPPNPKKLAALLRDLDYPWTGSVSSWLQRYGIERTSPFDLPSLGTIGGGNHFAEICSLEEAVDPSVASELGIVEGALYLIVHTGSRGLGSSILASQTKTNSNPCLRPDSPELETYLREHDYAVQWAVANRDLVAYRVMQCLYSSELDDAETNDLEKIIDVTHNSVTKHTVVISESETKELWIHRKGAAPHDKGIAPCPGSRGDFSWLLKPVGDGQLNVHSLAHGAGRRFGRQALHERAGRLSKSSLTTTSLGSEVVCTNQDLLIEEQPDAYKDVAVTVEDMEEHGICQGAIKLRPVVTYKIREEGR